MMSNKFKIWLTVLFFVAGTISPVYAQDNYSGVVEKIHYSHPNRSINGVPFDAVKQTGNTANPTLKVYIWGDLNEPYTKAFFDSTFGWLMNRYQDKALFIYNHRTFLSQDNSILAGMVGECAAQQGHFWDNIKSITNNLKDLNSLSYLQGVDVEKIKNCLANPYTKSIINISENDGKYFGFNGIPTVVVQNALNPVEYSIKVNGAQPDSVYERAFWEAENGDLNSKELSNVKVEIDKLKEEVQEVKTKQSFLEQQIQKIKDLLSKIWERLIN